MSGDLARALSLVDDAHAQDPTTHAFKPENSPSDSTPIPYELHYARKMSFYLHMHTPNASPILQIAIRAQHFRRWETPRSSYPEGRPGYLAWRTFLKKRQAEQAQDICLQCGFSADDGARVASLVSKEELKKGDGNGDPEAQILEDVACLVFLDDQLEGFQEEHDEEKILRILRKTWDKMGSRGKELAVSMEMTGKGRELMGKALAG